MPRPFWTTPARRGSSGAWIGIPQVLQAAAARLAHHTSRFQLFHRSYAQLGELLEAARHPEVAGILLDLGLSSFQLQESQRGFSFAGDEPLDMRFNPEEPGPTAATWLNRASQAELERIFREYGEEPRARRIARLVVQERRRRPFQTTGQLVKVLGTGPGTRGAQGETASSHPGLPGLTHCREPGVGRAGRLPGRTPRPGWNPAGAWWSSRTTPWKTGWSSIVWRPGNGPG